MAKQIDSIQDQTLYDALHKVEDSIDRDNSKISKFQERLGKIGVSLALKDALIFDTSSILTKSHITDSYTSELKIENGVESTVPERLIGEKLVKALSARKSIATDNPKSIKIKEGERQRPDNSELGFLQSRRDIKHAKRLHKQELRQEKSKEMERIFGGGIGLGNTARSRTKLHQFLNGITTGRQYRNGGLTAKQLLAEKARIKSEEKTTIQPAAVRRAYRRERRGAIYDHLRASQPAVTIVNKVKSKVLTRRADRVNSRMIGRYDQRRKILEELERRKQSSDL